MKIQIRDFGPIHKFDFDLSKDLTLIYGENNIGKSYALSLVYLLIKNLSKIETILFPFFIAKNSYQFFETNTKNKDRINKLEKKAVLTKSIINNKIIEDVLNDSLISVIASLNEAIKNSFGNELDNKFSDTKFQINIVFNELRISFLNNNDSLTSEVFLNNKFFYRRSEKGRQYRESNKEITFYTNEPIQLLRSVYSYVSDKIRNLIFEINKNVSDYYFLPASRSGLYMALSAFGQIFAKLSQQRHSLNNDKIGLPSIPEPVSDFYLNISDIDSQMKQHLFSDIVIKIEKEILEGKIEFDNKNKKLYYIPNNLQLRLDLSHTSSMVSEIGLIVAYLKYIVLKTERFDSKFIRTIEAKPVLFIEEPEAHLHPKIQVKLSEIFVELINSGCKIIMISHSNYVFNKLNNLVLEGKLDKNKYAPYILEQTEKGSIAKLMEIDDLGVEDENFIDVSEKLYYEQLKIIDKLNNDKKD